MNENYIFYYTVKGKTSLSGKGKLGNAVVFVVNFVVIILFNLFLYFAFAKKEEGFIYLAIFFGILILLFGPYQNFIKKYYFFALTKEGILIMKSVINFIPRTYKINIRTIYTIKSDNPLKSASVLFIDSNNKTIAKFNPGMINHSQFTKLLLQIQNQYPIIRLEVSPQQHPEIPFTGPESNF